MSSFENLNANKKPWASPLNYLIRSSSNNLLVNMKHFRSLMEMIKLSKSRQPAPL